MINVELLNSGNSASALLPPTFRPMIFSYFRVECCYHHGMIMRGAIYHSILKRFGKNKKNSWGGFPSCGALLTSIRSSLKSGRTNRSHGSAAGFPTFFLNSFFGRVENYGTNELPKPNLFFSAQRQHRVFDNFLRHSFQLSFVEAP